MTDREIFRLIMIMIPSYYKPPRYRPITCILIRASDVTQHNTNFISTEIRAWSSFPVLYMRLTHTLIGSALTDYRYTRNIKSLTGDE